MYFYFIVLFILVRLFDAVVRNTGECFRMLYFPSVSTTGLAPPCSLFGVLGTEALLGGAASFCCCDATACCCVVGDVVPLAVLGPTGNPRRWLRLVAQEKGEQRFRARLFLSLPEPELQELG